MNNERLNYGDRIIYMEGVVVDIDDCSISVDLKGPKVGQEFGWNMSFPEQLGPEINDHYVSNIEKERRKQEEMRKRLDNKEV